MRSKNVWKFLVIVVMFSLPLTLLAQVENWIYTYNGHGNDDDYARSIIQGSDGNIYAAGYSNGSASYGDFTVMSLTTAGDTNWVYGYNGPGNGSDYAESIVYGSDGNIYAAGGSSGSSTDYDFTVLSLTSAGDTNWVYGYNGPGNGSDYAESIVYGSDGNIYAAGYSTGSAIYGDFTVISLTTSGTERWVYRYNGPGNYDDVAFSIVHGSDGNVYATGTSSGSGTYADFTVISLTTAGDTNWIYRYNGPGNYYDQAYSIVYGSDGNIYTAGYSTDTDYDFTVISLTTAGDANWIYRYNGPGNGLDRARSIVQGSDGNIYIAGESYGTGTYYDFTVISLTSAGDTNWVYRYNGPGNDYDCANSIVQGSDGNIYAAGGSFGSYYDFTVISLTSAGDTNWVYRYNGPGNFQDYASSIIQGSYGNIYAAGGSSGSSTDYDFTVISLGPAGINERDVLDSYEHDQVLFVPSLFMDNIRIKLTMPSQNPLRIALHNICGRKVYEETYSHTPSSIIISGEQIKRLSSGLYILSASLGTENVGRFRLIKL